MEITSVTHHKNQQTIVELDGRRKLILHTAVVEKLGLREGDVIDREAVKGIAAESQRHTARDAALRHLDYRAHSYGELFDKLNRDFDDEICYETLNKLAELGLLNDREYAEQLAKKLIEDKKFGRYRARSEMRMRKLDNELIEEVLDTYDEESGDRLRQLIGRRYSRKLYEENGVRKVKAALARQGYSYDEINRALEDFEDDDNPCD